MKLKKIEEVKKKMIIKKEVYISIQEEEIDSNTLISRLAKDLFGVKILGVREGNFPLSNLK